jgi:hypothetical protein
MSDEIKKPANTPSVTPLTRTRDTGARKNPRKPPAKPREGNRRQLPEDDQSHHVDEYV